MRNTYYLKLDGIAGDVKEKGYENSMRLEDFSFQKKTQRDADAAAGDSASNRGGISGRPAYGMEQLRIVLLYGNMSPRLFKATVNGETFKTAVLYVLRPGKKGTLIKKYDLYGLRIALYQPDSINQVMPMDSITFDYLRVR